MIRTQNFKFIVSFLDSDEEYIIGHVYQETPRPSMNKILIDLNLIRHRRNGQKRKCYDILNVFSSIKDPSALLLCLISMFPYRLKGENSLRFLLKFR